MGDAALPALPKGANVIGTNGPLGQLPPIPGGASVLFDEKSLDTNTGVPTQLRAFIGSYYKPEDKLALVKQYLGDNAQPYGDDNYVYFNNKTQRWTLFNPKGLDWGDAIEMGRLVPEIVGGGVAGFYGSTIGPVGTYGGAIGGSQLAGEGYDAIVRSIAGTPDTRTLGEHAKDVAVNTAIDATMMGAGELAGPVIRKTFTGKSGREVANAANNLGMQNLPAGAVGNKGVQVAEGAVGQTVMGAPTIDKIYREATEELADAVRRITGEGGQMTQEGVGQMVIDRAKTFRTKFTTRSNELYSEVDRLMPKGRNFEAPNTETIMAELRGIGRDSEALAEALAPGGALNKLDALFKPNKVDLDGLTPEQIAELPRLVSYADLKALRSWVGDQMGDSLVLGTDASKAQLKRIYGALTRDMDGIAQGAGPEVAAAARNASRYYSAGMDAIDNKIAPLVQKNATEFRSGQAVYEAVNRGGARNQVQTDNALRAFVPPSEQARIGGRMVQDAAQTPANPNFSPSRFGGELNRMEAGTGQLPLPVQRLPGLDDARAVAGGMKDAGSRANFSNTAGAIGTNEGLRAGLTYLWGGADPTLLLTQFLAPKVVAGLMENKVFRDILMDTTSTTTKQIRRLVALGIGEETAKQIIDAKYSSPDFSLLGP